MTGKDTDVLPPPRSEQVPPRPRSPAALPAVMAAEGVAFAVLAGLDGSPVWQVARVLVILAVTAAGRLVHPPGRAGRPGDDGVAARDRRHGGGCRRGQRAPGQGRAGRRRGAGGHRAGHRPGPAHLGGRRAGPGDTGLVAAAGHSSGPGAAAVDLNAADPSRSTRPTGQPRTPRTPTPAQSAARLPEVGFLTPATDPALGLRRPGADGAAVVLSARQEDHQDRDALQRPRSWPGTDSGHCWSMAAVIGL